ncbi:MAG: magnesium/cobalt transporter CorA [Verrucomicrobia bacterium]|nr:magnesium/cobalt transporter CorA [Verrucomicrobiota bacterium]
MKNTLKETADKTLKQTLSTASAVLTGVNRVRRQFGSTLLKHHEHTPNTPAEPSAPGSSPGLESLGDISEPPAPGTVHIQSIDYGPETCRKEAIETLVPWLKRARPEGTKVRWVNVDGLHPWVIDQLRRHYGFHTLAGEDALRVPQRPKLEEYDNCSFIVVRMIRLQDQRLHSEQVSLFLFDDTVLTLQERAGDVWDPIRLRLERGGSRIRNQGAAYLLYAMLDALVDHCFPILEQFGDQMEDLEREIMGKATPATQQRILGAKRDLAMLRRILWPMREIANALQTEKNTDIPDDVKAYMRDVYDHTVQLIDILESYREMAGGLNDLYMSVVSNRMNEIMKVLTIMASFFIPITFVAGVYGMNFEHIPELHLKYGYPVFWIVCALIVAGLLRYFHRKGWLGGGDQ